MLDLPSLPGAAELLRLRARGPLDWASWSRIHALRRPADIAIKGSDGALTWAELEDRIDRLAATLERRCGVEPGHAVLVISETCPEAIEAHMALSRLGASAIAVGTAPLELARLAASDRIQAVFVGPGASGAIDAVRATLGVGRDKYFFEEEDLFDGPEPHAAWPRREHARATAGTDELPLRVDDRHLAACPMDRPVALGVLRRTLRLGGTVVVGRALASAFDAEVFLAAVQEHRITTTTVSPAMLEQVLGLAARTRAKYDTRSLQVLVVDGALCADDARRLTDEFGFVLHPVE